MWLVVSNARVHSIGVISMSGALQCVHSAINRCAHSSTDRGADGVTEPKSDDDAECVTKHVANAGVSIVWARY